MALDASDERGQGRTIENGACRLAEKIAGAIYVQLETGADLTRILRVCPSNAILLRQTICRHLGRSRSQEILDVLQRIRLR